MADLNQKLSGPASLVAGSLSGLVVALATQPLDVARTMMQRDPKFYKHPINSSTFSYWKEISGSDGFVALWRGGVPTAFRVGLGAGMYFAMLNRLTLALSPTSSGSVVDAGLGPGSSFFIGFTARTCVSAILLPLTVVKTRLEAGHVAGASPGLGMIAAFGEITRKEGYRALFRGALPTVLRDAPFSGFYLLLFNPLRRMLTPPDHSGKARTPSAASNFVAGLAAGAVATALTNPADVVRTRMQLPPFAAAGPESVGARWVRSGQVAAQVVREEGWGALGRGMGPRVAKRSVQAAGTWTLFQEAARRLVGPSPG